MDIVSYILSKSYVDKTLVGMGALKGAPCTISGIVDNPDGTHDITFSWKDNSDVTHTSVLTVKNGETPTIVSTEIVGGHRLTFTTTDPAQSVSFDIMDGEKGERGVSVIRANVDANNYLTLTLSDGNIINAGQIKTIAMVDNALSTTSANPVENKVITTALNNKVDKINGKGLSTEDFTTAEKDKLSNIENNAQVNTLENLIINGTEATIVDKKIALNIITSAVSNLQNYYLKTETYTKQEIEDLIGSTVGVTISIVEQLPAEGQSNVIYFLPTETEGVYSQYIYTDNAWVLIGSTTVDLSNYYTKTQVDTLLNGKQNTLTIDAFPTSMSNNPVASGGVYSAIAQMQPQFQFTNMPTASATNLGFVYQYIGSAGTYAPNMFYRCVYNSLAGEYQWEEVIFHATVTVDSALSTTSTNPVQNKVITEALEDKQDIIQFTTMPSAQDNLGRIIQYVGATTTTYQNACFYKAVYDSEHDVYMWTMVKFSADISVDNVLSHVSENPVQNKVITDKFDEYQTTFVGTQAEWDALTSTEQDVYDQVNITDDGETVNLGVYLEKKSIMPIASEDEMGKIYLYVGETTQYYTKGTTYQCVSDGQATPTYSWVALINFGTASTKNSTDRVAPDNRDLVESQSVYSAINSALSSIYTPRGNLTCAELTSSLLIAGNVGNVYEMSDSGTTTALFLQGAGQTIAVGDNVGIINAGEGRILFNLMANAFDLTDYQKKDLASTIEGATTVEGALDALSTNKQPKTLDTPITVSGVSRTTVESALGSINDSIAQYYVKGFNGTHDRYVKLGTLPYSASGQNKQVSLDINVFFDDGIGTIHCDIQSRNSVLRVKGWTDIDLATSSVGNPRIIVSNENNETYHIYLDCNYAYLTIRMRVSNIYDFIVGDFTASASITGTEAFNSLTDDGIEYLKNLIAKVETTSILDANDCIETGVYSNVNVHQPLSGFGFTMFVELSANKSYCHQTAHLNVADDLPSVTYVRKGRYLNDAWSWSSWEKLVTESDLNSFVKTGTLTGTTNEYGALGLGVNVSNRKVLFAYCPSRNSTLVNLWVAEQGSYYVTLMKESTSSPQVLPMTNVTIVYFYV